MSEAVRGVIHGKTIELMADPGIEDGQIVEVIVRAVSGAKAEKLRASAGSLADLPPEAFAELEAIVQEQRQVQHRELAE